MENEKKIKEKASDKLGRFFVINEIKTNARMIGDLFQGIMQTEKTVKNETFEEAIDRMNLSPLDIELSYKRNRIIFFINLAVGLFVIFYALFNVFTAKSIFDIIFSLSAFGPIVLFLVIAFRASFRCWQTRRQELGGLKIFVMNYKEWWPISFGATDIARKSRKLANRPQRQH
jgi:hypothetical protein